MSLFSDNIKYLRVKRNASQRIVAEKISISRDRYAKYEDGINSPSLDLLVLISRYFHVSIDVLLTVDLKKVSIDNLIQLGDNRILLPIAVDKDGDNLIEVVPSKAKAGYLAGHSDPEFIQSLQQISLPFLSKNKYRAFPIEGDSMPPHDNGSLIIGKYVEDIRNISDGKTYILLTKNEGIVYKRVYKIGTNKLNLNSDNSLYKSYSIPLMEVIEIWQYECSIERTEAKINYDGPETMQQLFIGLRDEIRKIKS